MEEWKPAQTGALIRDILETYHWESWTADRLACEVARIRRIPVDAKLIERVRSTLCKIIGGDDIVRGETRVVSYTDGKSFQHPRMTARWKESA